MLDTRLLKFLKSTQAAFPLGRDPWADLAHGLFASDSEVREWVDDLNAAGAIVGMWTEPNVRHPAISETLCIGEPPGVRWSAQTGDGTLASRWQHGAEATEGWPAERWFKIGMALDLRVPGEQSDPFSASPDRSLIPETPNEWPRIDPEVVAELRALSQPVPLQSDIPFWSYLQSATRLPDPRASIPRVVLSRLARRFALRLSPTALGWRGCGMACWRLADEDAPRAAAALAAITCTGDVAIRTPTADWPFNVSAVLLCHGEGSGEKNAAEISRRWGRDLGRWIGFQVLR